MNIPTILSDSDMGDQKNEYHKRKVIKMSVGEIVLFSVWGCATVALWSVSIHLWLRNKHNIAITNRVIQDLDRMNAKYPPK